MFSPIRRSILYFAEWRFDMLYVFHFDAVRLPRVGEAISTADTHHPSCIAPPKRARRRKGRVNAAHARQCQETRRGEAWDRRRRSPRPAKAAAHKSTAEVDPAPA